MKILLINPPSENEIIGNNPSIIEEERGYNPPLGLLYIAAYLEKHTAHQVRILDTQVEKISYADLPKIIDNLSPDVVGITTMTLTLIDVLKTAQLVQATNKKIKVVLGGPHVHIFPNETINQPGVDFLVIGEGEISFKELVENINDKNKLKSVEGLVFKDNGNIINTGKRNLIENLDELPFPARHLTQYMNYSSLLAKRAPITTMFTSRGCPYGCSFCDRPHLGKKFRWRSAQNIVDEMETCIGLGIREFLIYDDTFTVKHQRVHDICDEIIRRKLDIGWDIRTRVDNIDRKMLEKLKQANCERIHYGVEAGTDRIIKQLNKGITIEAVSKAFKATNDVGISTLAYFMIGNPTETKEDILTTFRFMKKLKPDYVHMTILTPFPATRIYIEGLKAKVFVKDYWREFARHPTPDFRPPHWDVILSKKQLEKLLIHGYKHFYLQPRYIFKRIMDLNGFVEFKKKAKAGLKVLFMR